MKTRSAILFLILMPAMAWAAGSQPVLTGVEKPVVVKAGVQTNSLDAKLHNADAALAAANAGDIAGACNLMAAFINEVNAQSGKALTSAQADQLIAAANQIRAVFGC